MYINDFKTELLAYHLGPNKTGGFSGTVMIFALQIEKIQRNK
jgi:hypothetical protein